MNCVRAVEAAQDDNSGRPAAGAGNGSNDRAAVVAIDGKGDRSW